MYASSANNGFKKIIKQQTQCILADEITTDIWWIFILKLFFSNDIYLAMCTIWSPQKHSNIPIDLNSNVYGFKC
jgi:hypothetical protein